jgi:hypothetical protein
MTDVDHIALWAGLISSIISIVLSVVAIAFAILVDRSSRQVTAQTIKSLQKIEADVDRLSGDTRELIKGAWDKMLGSNYPSAPARPDDSIAKELAAGIATELRAELEIGRDKGHAVEETPLEAKLDGLIQRLEGTLAAQMRGEPSSERAGALVDHASDLLRSLSPTARTLASLISGFHLSRQQYLALAKGALSDAIAELRAAGILVPLRGVGPDGKQIPVYFYPPQLTKVLRAVIPLMPSPPEETLSLVANELKRIKYSSD